MINVIGDVLKDRDQLLTVNSTVNRKNKNNNTVNSIPISTEYEDIESKTNELLEELQGQPEYLADKLSRELDDQRSKRWYLLIAKNNNPGVLLDALSNTLSVYREGGIRTTKAKYFIGILVKKGISIKFKK
jgi:hypothetical protein